MSDTTTTGLPAHLDGTRPAPLSARFLAGVVDTILAALIEIVYLAALLVLGTAAYGTDGTGTTVVTLALSALVVVALVRWWFVSLWRNGQTPGMRAMGVAWASWDAAGAPGARTLAKVTVRAALGAVSFGVIPAIVYLVSRDAHGRFWFDRVSGLIAVDVRNGANPLGLKATATRGGRRGRAAATAQTPASQDRQTDESSARGGPSAAQGPPDADETLERTIAAPQVPEKPSTAETSAAVTHGEGIITSVPWETAPPATSARGGPEMTSAPLAAHAVPGVPGAAVPPLTEPMPPPPVSSVPSASAARTPVPGPPTAQVPAPPAEDRTVARPVILPPLYLHLDTGHRVPLSGTVLLGRDPVAVPPWDDSVLVPVVDPERSISKTHLAITVEATRVKVRDLGSTNGTVVISPDGSSTQVIGETTVDASVGAVVVFGERRLTVER